MKLSVYFTPLAVAPPVVTGKPVLVIDILRATTTMVTALANGARAILSAETADEAMRMAQNLKSDDLLLAGERNLERIDGFTLGISPLEMTSEVVAGKQLIMMTTNGSVALAAVGLGNPVLIAAALNFTAVAQAANEAFEDAGEIVIVCAGREGMFALEDAYAAGRFVQSLITGRGRGAVALSDGAIAARELVRRYGDKWRRAISASAAARTLKLAKLKADVDAATESDKYDIVPRYADKLVKVPT
ncbi:MAG: 2-phosphosulfolactate phosphatase [Gemmatimonadales bacterium]